MSAAPLTVVVLAAGEGTRLRGSVPKALTSLWGRPAVGWTVRAAAELGPERLVVVAGRHLEAIRAALAGIEGLDLRFALQDPPRGTGHAVQAAAGALAGVAGPLLILYGDCPLVTGDLLRHLLDEHRSARRDLTLATTRLPDPRGYGRIVRGKNGGVKAIVEEADADERTRAIDEINTGLWVVEQPGVFADLERIGDRNAQGEVYLTDLVGVLRERGGLVQAVEVEDADACLGFNDQADLALARHLLRERILAGHLERGVEIVDPATTFLDADVQIEPGARVLPCTIIEGDGRIAAGCEVGPFAHLRAGTVLEPGAEVGNFVETKKARLGAGAKAKHLTYLGDATVGERTNVGAGTITANYDGKTKHATSIGARVHIGSGTVLVAPVRVEDDATTGAGAIVTRGSVVGAGETWVGVPAKPLRARTRGKEAP